jgi:subtilisin family serine protease
VSIAALVALSAVSAAGAARSPKPEGLPGAFTPAIVPLGLSNKPATVVVELAGDPVTVAESKDTGSWNGDQKRSWKDSLRSKQDPVEQEIRSRGGTVLATYQSAYNGIKAVMTPREAAQLASVPGVVAVHPLQSLKPDNTNGVPLVGGPAVWGGAPGFAGEGMKVAVIDTGIDYTHAGFGGSGNVADYNAALASDTLPANAAWFGATAPRVKGGYDFVGDDYNADSSSPAYQPVPHPDPNPLDCNGHGTHTAGTTAGSGVLSNGSTYTGPYDAGTISSHTWNIGPGVAPKADIYALRVFGCEGSTDVVIDAIEWAVDHDMDVINMSLGSSFGSPDSPDAVASTNAAKAGVIVVASAGNSGSNAYITGSPAAGTGAISVAANDPTPTFPGANLTLTKADATPGGTRTAIVANGFSPVPTGPVNIKVIFSAPNVISLGCSTAAFGGPNSLPPNTFAVVARGTCARVAKAIFGQQAGAAGVIMVNNSSALPPYEGKITSNPDDGTPYTVTIPFLGTAGGSNPSTSTAGAQFRAANGGTMTLVGATLPNTGYKRFASFTSFGPATSDSSLKPNVTAPGVSIASVGMGTGTEASILSGTSMAAPHTAGMAALVKQAHPSWRKVKYWTAAIENTADPAGVANYSTQGGGTGFIQAVPATQTDVVALGTKDTGALSFGFAELSRDYNESAEITLRNFGNSPATFNVADSLPQGSPHTMTFSSSTVTVPARGERDVRVRLSVPATTAGGATLPLGGVLVASSPLNQASGVVTLTPASGSNNGVTLRVPYLLAPQAVSDVNVRQSRSSASLRNSGVVGGTADWFAWGIKDKKNHGVGSNDLRAVGAQFIGDPDPANERVVFAISTNSRWSNATQNEFDISIDVNNDGAPDYVVVVADFGALTTGSFNGVNAVAVFDLNEGGSAIWDLPNSPTDSSVMTVPVYLDQLRNSDAATSIGGANQRFTYSIEAFGLSDNTYDAGDMSATFNPFSSAVNNGMYQELAPGDSASQALTVNAAEQALSPALGWMVVSLENRNRDEATLLELRR